MGTFLSVDGSREYVGFGPAGVVVVAVCGMVMMFPQIFFCSATTRD
jgi:hypothetical protein